MSRIVRFFLAVALGLTGLLFTAAPAIADDPRTRLPKPEPTTLSQGDYCQGFDVRIKWTSFRQYIVRQTTGPNGETILKITGNARVIATNLKTGKSVSYNVSGPGTIVVNSDGSFSVDAGGPNLFWTTRANSFSGVPPISYTTGRVSFTVDASGKTTQYNLRGRRTDVCAVLAAS